MSAPEDRPGPPGAEARAEASTPPVAPDADAAAIALCPNLAEALAADPDIAQSAAAIHAAAFDGDVPGRPWSAGEIAGFAAAPGALALVVPDAMLLGRVAGPEAELVTVGVRPEARGRGLGRALVVRFAALADAAGAEEAFLEVAETNSPAQALYSALGWETVGRRRDYYRDARGLRLDALAMRLQLRRENGGGDTDGIDATS